MNRPVLINFIRRRYLYLSFIFLLLAGGCTEDVTEVPYVNKPPKTGLFLSPDSVISQQASRLKVNWWGDDSDGLVVGFYFTWDNTNWSFTTRKDSTFSLQIGAADTIYTFRVAAVDDAGNGVFDASVVRNGINLGPEPFEDANGNGVYDAGEVFVDIGAMDPNPVSLPFPIKNSAPVISLNTLTVLPDSSYPVMTFGWNASDIDGDQTISAIELVLNDSTASGNIVSIPGNIRLITLRVQNFASNTVSAEILLNGLETTIHPVTLPGMQLDAVNRLFVRARDISGATSRYLSIPDAGINWYVKKPKGQFLLFDDYTIIDDAADFYSRTLHTINGSQLSGKFDTWDYNRSKVPFSSVTFPLTLKLFKYVLWYSDTNPSLDLAAGAVKKFNDAGGKILFSMSFPSTFDVSILQGFLPIDSTTNFINFLFPNSQLNPDSTRFSDFPVLTTVGSIPRVRSFYPSTEFARPFYKFASGILPGNIGFTDTADRLYFIGLPLSKCNGTAGTAEQFISKVLFEKFGLTP